MELGKYILHLGERTCIMGILNVTPDSFSDGGKFLDIDKAVKRARELSEEGADIIDVGGESSRPGSRPVSAEEEAERVVPVIRAISSELDKPISVDTYKSGVAREALKEGAVIVNDITALKGDPDMARTIAEFDAGVVLMHMKGSPDVMQAAPVYGDVVSEVFDFLKRAINAAEKSGIAPDKIMIDPGIGFGKTLEHNLALIRGIRKLKELAKPVLVGTSRKSFLGAITGKDVGERTFATAASVSAAIMNGADIVRVHDVGDMADVTRVIDAIIKSKF